MKDCITSMDSREAAIKTDSAKLKVHTDQIRAMMSELAKREEEIKRKEGILSQL